MAWKLYSDAALTTEITSQLVVHQTDLSDNPQDFVYYYGNTEDDPGDNQILQQQEATAPGTNPIVVSIVDANPGSGHEASEITLASTAGALDNNIPGASLDLGTTLQSGVSGAVPIHVRVENAVTNVGLDTELSLQIVATIDEEVV
jgi:hypothetical protein